MIDSNDQRFKQATISETWSNQSTNLVLDIEDSEISDSLKNAMDLDEDGVTKFQMFKRLGDVWVFADDQSQEAKVTVLDKEQIYHIFSDEDSQEFGKHIWISQTDENLGQIEKSVIVAIS